MATPTPITWRQLPSLLRTAPGRCRVRKMLLEPLEPALWTAAGQRRRLTPRSHRLVAVTGSFGKTTTARAIRAALGLSVGDTAGPNARYALAIALLQTAGRGPFSVFEVGIGRPGQMRRMAKAFRPDIAAVTSIGGEHAISMGTLERTRAEKFELLRALPPDGIAVLNGDDPHVRWMAERVGRRVITFGYGDGNEVRAGEPELDWPNGMQVTITTGDWHGTVRARLIGAHSAYAVMAAMACAAAADIDPDVAAARLASMTPTPGRMQVVPLSNGAHLIRDEYKSGLETIHAALAVFARVPAARRIAVLGEITEPPAPQRQHHIEVGRRLATIADRVILVGHSGKGYRTGLRQGGLSADQIVDAGHGWRGAHSALEGTLGPGDVVLLKGRLDQRLERVALALMGRHVRCDLVSCSTPLGRCDTCPMLERGWTGYQPVF